MSDAPRTHFDAGLPMDGIGLSHVDEHGTTRDMNLFRNETGFLVVIKTQHAGEPEPFKTTFSLTHKGLDMLTLLLSSVHQLPPLTPKAP